MSTKIGNFQGQWAGLGRSFEQLSPKQSGNPQTPVLPLAELPPAERAGKLEALANEPKSENRARARYLLASDLIQQKQGKKALDLLEGLEGDYRVLESHIALKRAQAYELTGDTQKAQTAWEELLKKYPKEPVAAEALFVLGKTNPKYWQQAIAEFPSHPRSLEIARRELEKDPNQPQLLLALAKYAPKTPKITEILDRLVNQPPASPDGKTGITLKPEEWEAIANAYMEKKEYFKASAAYEKAARTPRNAYLVARALDLGGKRSEAKVAYELVETEFPNTPETGLSLLRAASLAQPLDAVPAFDKVIAGYPDQAGAALVAQAKVLDQLKSTKAAAVARQQLLSKYGSSEAAAEYRWTEAETRAARGDIQGAWQFAEPIATQNPNSKFASRAGYWVGKWAKRLGKQQEAKAAFEYVVSNYPQSYYAWRSAAMLGWPGVGDFTTVRSLSPKLARPSERPVLPAGSATLKELYQLGQDRDSWTLWQAEFQNRVQPTVAEQFTNAQMRMTQGEYLEGITEVGTLEDRETKEDRAAYEALKEQPLYWQALYPFPYVDLIEKWSTQHKVNPLLVTAVVRQESRFMPKIKSVAGAVGLMQVMPTTGAWVAQQIGLKEYNPENPNDNIRLGSWYLGHTHDQYKNNSMLAIASYNAGPGNVSKWLAQKGAGELDEFVEAIPFEETKWYVKQVFGNYWNYLRVYNPEISQRWAKHSAEHPPATPTASAK